MPKKNQPYIYGPGDNPLTVAQQNGITPDQLFQANPGGYPFATGQQINIPVTYQYSAPIGPQLPASQQNAGRGTMLPANPIGSIQNPNLAMRGRGYQAPGTYAQSEQGAPVLSSQYGTDDSWYRPAVPAATATTPAGPTGPANNGYGGFERASADNTDFMNTAAARYNAANNIPFLQQSRWDPRRRRYISVGQWLRQNRRGGRGRGGGGGRKAPEQKQQEFTLTNSFLDFNAASG